MTRRIFAPAARPHAPFRLLRLPYAGISSATYLTWPHELDLRVERVCIGPPGRGMRFEQPPIDCVDRLAEQASRELTLWLDRPFNRRITAGQREEASMKFGLPGSLASSTSTAPKICRQRLCR